MASTCATSCALVVFTLFLVLQWRRTKHSRLPLPPGPSKLPLVGNLFDVPANYEWKTYAAWSRQYNSDIIHLNLAGTSIVVLSSVEATDALLEKRSSIYSHRPRLPMLVELMGWEFHVALMKYGARWRTYRRLLLQGIDAKACISLRSKQLAATRSLLRALLRTPERFTDHIRHSVGSTVISVAYGIDVLPENDPYIALGEELMASALLGRFLVDFFPILKYLPDWVPGAGFKRVAKEGRKTMEAALNVPFEEVERQLRAASGSALHSFTATCLRALNDVESTNSNQENVNKQVYFDRQMIKDTAAVMYIGGLEPTTSVISAFVLAMMANPEAQSKAQEEIDRALSEGTLPDFSDRDSGALPYVEALIKEVLRWGCVGPKGVSHFLEVEDEYRGYRIPAGSIVIPNVWAIMNDETMYPNPGIFDPERFLLEGKLKRDILDPQLMFGFGRRICPGRHLAADSLWLTIVSILATFNITKAVGDDGKVIEPSYEFSSAVTSVPLSFRCSILPRSQSAQELVEGTANV
ncbi:cytochrome P450 [Roridomyces roridus]|uniref:Cytochrome P450 n=1 Tax=Roridomyces roridus TaxID=1738132 RepID=A0AAD7FLN4_9AGAR|nr:cytochrome P450 [Roridomyces roridus]